ncbi:MAG: class I SAM-dependent methyltransferase [Porphyrobacter sp.]|nr:class I SAM-dependent methyltransferase [Porphyrobacter sp.]
MRNGVRAALAVAMGAVAMGAAAMAPLPVAAQKDVAAASEAASDPAPDSALSSVLAHPRRAADRARDAYRHPAETLAFFRVEPGMSVVDFTPSGGWYSRVLIPYLGPQGTYIGLNPAVSDGATGYMAALRDAAGTLPGKAREWVGEGAATVIGANLGSVPEALDGTVDRVLIFREMHNIRRNGWLHDTMLTARRLLKADGMVGIVQHRAKPDAPAAYTMGDKGYQREKDVVAFMDAYGFDLVGSSEINANPRDPANWEGGVWTLPPTYAGAGEDAARRAELDAVGESDRMTLLFRKRA